MATDEKEEPFYDCEYEQAPVGSEFQDAEDVVATATEPTAESSGEASNAEVVPETDEYAVDETHLKELEEAMTEDEKQVSYGFLARIIWALSLAGRIQGS